ncbi:uncharacterized protein [Gossypium hirsutum]|uniref:Retrovirus-related Pol polyprotein from transposon TNT 1-94-like beta-barrel domain-containing protein n=1 Tax=Gossypium hirsutum TaxID=3635 RepID=A0ABM3ABX2_GOSHI|nr:uncharacterized protein LOC121218730 [Gossypium hirsutum]
MACDTPKQAWDKLKEEFQRLDKTRQQQLINLRRDFENLRIKDSETIKQYADRIMAIVNNIKLLGDEFSDQRVVESHNNFTRESREEQTEWRSILRELFRLEAEKAQALAQITKCRGCKQLGHIEKVCKNKPKAQQQNLNQAQAAEDVEGQEEHVFIGSCFASSSKVSKIWLIDNGCTHHMAFDESIFKELDTSFGSKVRIGNSELLMAKGKCKAMIGTKSSNKIISVVLYVPDIDQNLLSVGQLLEKGYSFFFEGKTCLIKDTTDQVLTTVAMHDRTFIVDVNQLSARACTLRLMEQACGIGGWGM